MIHVYELQNILSSFGIFENVLLTEILENLKTKDKYRIIYKIITNSNTWVCRISNEKGYTCNIIEKQEDFAMILRQNGVSVPLKIKSNGKYCQQFDIDNIIVNVTLERFIKSVDSENPKNLFYKLGNIIAEIHNISENKKSIIGKSFLSSEILSGNAKFNKIILKSKPKIYVFEELKVAEELHDSLVDYISVRLCNLPKGAVHGDLGIYNNLLIASDGLYVIDFNLCGDEYFIIDALSALFSSLYYDIEIPFKVKDSAIGLFLKGYIEVRKISFNEKALFPYVAALFDGVYYSKMCISYWNKGRQKEALKLLTKTKEHFDIDRYKQRYMDILNR